MFTAHFDLNTGAKIPALGFGTWEINPENEVRRLVDVALQAGYRSIDTARIYGNEHGVGDALRESGIARSEVFISTKLWNDDQGYDRTMRAVEKSLERLGLEYLDLYLIHWPATTKRHESWRAFEQLYRDGRIKAAGVCNYTVEHLEDLQQRSELVPAVNQVEFHPFIYEQQLPLLNFCKQHQILVEAYSPLSRISHEKSDVVKAIAVTHRRTVQQVLLRWCFQLGIVALTRSTSREHIVGNFRVFDFKLSPEDMRQLSTISDGERVTWDPAGMG